MKILFLLSLITSLILTTPTATVDYIESNIAHIEISHNEELYYIDIPVEDFNHNLFEGAQFEVSSTLGQFVSDFKDIDGNVYYQFRSYDDKVWWVLTEGEIGYSPKIFAPYNLVYYNNQTTDCFDCEPKYDCECEVYDDIFLTIHPLTHDREIDGIYNNGSINTSDGHVWKYVDDSLKNNSSVKVIINDNGTNIIDDDIIKEVKNEI